MPSQPWLEQFQNELVRRRLPKREVARLVTELSDHVTDVTESLRSSGRKPIRGAASCLSPLFQENHMSMEASVAEYLGSPVEVADASEREFRQRKNLLSRSSLATFCTFVLLPLPAFILAMVASMALTFLFGKAIGPFIPETWEHPTLTATQASISQIVAGTIYIVLPAMCVVSLFVRIARWTPNHRRWAMTACLLVALGAMSGNVLLKFGDVPGKNQLLVGFGVGRSNIDPSHIAQFLIPFVTGMIVLRRSTKLLRPPISP